MVLLLKWEGLALGLARLKPLSDRGPRGLPLLPTGPGPRRIRHAARASGPDRERGSTSPRVGPRRQCRYPSCGRRGQYPEQLRQAIWDRVAHPLARSAGTTAWRGVTEEPSDRATNWADFMARTERTKPLTTTWSTGCSGFHPRRAATERGPRPGVGDDESRRPRERAGETAGTRTRASRSPRIAGSAPQTAAEAVGTRPRPRPSPG